MVTRAILHFFEVIKEWVLQGYLKKCVHMVLFELLGIKLELDQEVWLETRCCLGFFAYGL